MKRRKNAVYKGQSTRESTDTGGDRKVVNAFYDVLNSKLFDDDEIEIIPPEQVNPAHDLQDQACIIVDYCIRKILPEATGLYLRGDEVTPQLRALAPVVDQETAEAVREVVLDAADAVAAYAAVDVAYAAARAARTVRDAAGPTAAARDGARCVYHALVACIEADHEAAYNRIIALTNEMLESL